MFTCSPACKAQKPIKYLHHKDRKHANVLMSLGLQGKRRGETLHHKKNNNSWERSKTNTLEAINSYAKTMFLPKRRL